MNSARADFTRNAVLSGEEIKRYSRHLLLPEIGMSGQRQLKAARVLVIGAGGLGCPTLLYLAAAGIGRLGIIDHDAVELSNLQRQVLFTQADLGRNKAATAKARVQALNPEVEVLVYEQRLEAGNALEIIAQYDLVVDCTDNFATRYLSNDACVLLGKPNIYASIFRFDGQLSVFNHGGGPCYRCLYPDPPPPEMVPSCAEGGVVGVLPGILGALQANEAIKVLLDLGDSMAGRLLTFDALALEFAEYTLEKNPLCPVCSEHRTIHHPIDYQQFCGLTDAAATADVRGIHPRDLQQLLAGGEPMQLIDVRSHAEYDIARIGSARLLPLDSLDRQLEELDKDALTICFCHKGKRSQRACELLNRHGFTQVMNLLGGIDQWSLDVSRETPRY